MKEKVSQLSDRVTGQAAENVGASIEMQVEQNRLRAVLIMLQPLTIQLLELLP